MGATVGKLHDDTILDIANEHTQIARYYRNTLKNTTAVLLKVQTYHFLARARVP